MSWWKKESYTKFVRNKKGEVVKVKRTGDKSSLYKSLTDEYYKKHPEEKPSYKAKKTLKKLGKGFKKFCEEYEVKPYKPPKF